VIVESGIGAKALVTGGSIVVGIVLIAGMTGGAKVAETSADRARLAAAVCSYRRAAIATASATSATSGPRLSTAGARPRGLNAEQLDNARIIAAAASLGVERKTIVADIARALQENRPGDGGLTSDPNEFREQAEHIVDTVTDQLCRELSHDLLPLVGDLTGESPSEVAARAKIAVRAALSMLGVPYSWGGGGTAGASFGIGKGATTKGFDCSGLTQYAWGQAGISIPRVTYDQWNHGTRVRGTIQPGDLVFYDTNVQIPGPDHVGMAISSTYMVHAPRTGEVIRIEGIHRSGFMGAVRPSPNF
jgi:cell wall-associated NlpC family hydrolase